MAEHDPQLRGRSPAYDQDYGAWLGHQVALLKAGRWSELDKDRLIDEVESLGRSDFKGFVSAIEIVIVHMLKWDRQPDKRSRSWIASIEEHRARIEQELEDSPSYKSRTDEAVGRAFRTARIIASGETGLDLRSFPADNPYSWGDIVGREHSLD